MGVSWVVTIPSLEGKTGSQVIETVQRRIEQLAPQQSTNFTVVNEVFFPVSGVSSGPPCNVLTNTEYPVSMFAILDTGTKVTTDCLFSVMMLKMKGFYNSKTNHRTECKGNRYEVGDFVVKVGSVSYSAGLLGTLLEVEYQPCNVAAMCHGLLREFIMGLLGGSVELPPSVLKLQESTDPYEPADTMGQYVQQFASLRKSQAV